MTNTAEHFAAEWERAVRSGHDKWLPHAEPPQSWPLTDADKPLIGWSIIPDRPELAYLADPEASRPATEIEQEKYDARLIRDDYRWLYGAPQLLAAIRPAPVAVPAPALTDAPSADPAPVHCDRQDDPAPAAPSIAIAVEDEHGDTQIIPVRFAVPVAVVKSPEPLPAGGKMLAAAAGTGASAGPAAAGEGEAHGLGDLDKGRQKNLAAFHAAHDAQDEHEATRQIPAVDAITTTTPAITDGGDAA